MLIIMNYDNNPWPQIYEMVRTELYAGQKPFATYKHFYQHLYALTCYILHGIAYGHKNACAYPKKHAISF